MSENRFGRWFKSSFSESAGCVEVRMDATGVRLRNTRDRQGPELVFTYAEWLAFVKGVVEGEFSPPR